MKTIFENIFDAYCPMLHSIALQLCTNNTQAKKIIRLAYKKVDQQNINWQKNKPFCIDLIKLIIQTAQEKLCLGKKICNFSMKQFDSTPLLHKLLVEQLSLENYCFDNNITRNDALLSIRYEFGLIREAYSKNTLDAGVRAFQLN